MRKLDAKQLRDLKEKPELPDIKRIPFYLILDNVYDTYNIGGLFRLADALAAEKIFLCGDSETPPNHRIKKASIGTYKVVAWEYQDSAAEAIRKLKNQNKDIHIVSVELDERSVPYHEHTYSSPLAIVVGNETHGVSDKALALSDAIVDLPMHGYNISLNVIVSAAVVAYHAHNLLHERKRS